MLDPAGKIVLKRHICFFLCLLSFSILMGPGSLLAWNERRPFICPSQGDVITGFRDEYTGIDGSNIQHTGIDIAGEPGRKVRAAANGIISYTGISSTGGLTVVIRHNSSIRTTYLNLAAIYVSRGDSIRQGESIGCLGAEDDISSETCHLHFAVIYENSYLDPVALLDIDYSSISRYLRLSYVERDFRVY